MCPPRQATREGSQTPIGTPYSRAALSLEPKQRGTMKDRDHLNETTLQPVHDSVVTLDDLAERLVTNLGYHSSREGVAFKSGDAAMILSTRRSA